MLPIHKITEEDRKRWREEARKYEEVHGHPLPRKPGFEESLCGHESVTCKKRKCSAE